MRSRRGLPRFLLIWACLCLAPSWADAGPEQPPGPALSIEYLGQRSYHSELKILRKLGDFDGYRSYEVAYDSDGLILRALMNVPREPAPAAGYPVLVMNHGNANGRWDTFKANYSTMQDSVEYRERMDATPVARFAREGFLVLYPDYRGHGNSENNGWREGYWQLDRNGEKVLDRNGDPVPRILDNDGLRFGGWVYTAYYTIDVLNLLAALENRSGFANDVRPDLDNVFMWGRSLGGDVTARVISCTDRVRAASLWVPATTSLWDQAHHYHYDSPDHADGISMENLFVDLRTYNRVHGTALRARDLEPDNFIERVKTPVMVQVSMDDRGVRSAWGIQYHYALQEYEVESELKIHPGEDHVFRGEVLERAIEADLLFFRKHVRHGPRP